MKLPTNTDRFRTPGYTRNKTEEIRARDESRESLLAATGLESRATSSNLYSQQVSHAGNEMSGCTHAVFSLWTRQVYLRNHRWNALTMNKRERTVRKERKRKGCRISRSTGRVASRRSVACDLYYAETKGGTRYLRHRDKARQFRSRVGNGTHARACPMRVRGKFSLLTRRDDFHTSREYSVNSIFTFDRDILLSL